jgi:uncharacterized membrane protein YkoI
MTPTPRKSGIRLPWSQHEESDVAAPANVSAETTEAPAASETPATADPAAGATNTSPAVGTAEGAAQAAPQAASGEAAADDTDNALLASLITAMREVAERERESSVSTLRQSVDEAVETLRQRAAEGAEQLRERSESDIAAIGDWVRAETERITSEGERRRETRRQLLTTQLSDHEQRSGTEIEGLYARIQDYERDLTAFFAQLHEINDPAAFGAAAKRMPRPPSISAATSPAAPGPSTTSDKAAAPAPAETAAEPSRTAEEASTEAEPMAAETTADATAPEATVAEAAAEARAEADAAGSDDAKADDAKADDAKAEPLADAMGEPAAPPSSSIVPETHEERLSALGIDRNGSDADVSETSAEAESAGAEAEAPSDPLRARLAELDAKIGGETTSEPATATVVAPGAAGEVATAIVVHGLGSFGAITSFKQALERVDGVHGISLSLGPTGEFVYRATHEADFDLVAAIEQIEHGGAQIERQPDGSLRVVVQRGR